MCRHRRTSRALGLGLALLCVVAAPAVARAEGDALAVLGIESVEVGDALGAQLTEALRHKAAETQGVQLVPGKDLIELKMVFGCDGEAPACLAQAGRSLGADKLIYGSLKKAEGGKSIAVSLKLLDVRDLAIAEQVSEVIPKRGFSGPAIAAAAQRWFGKLVVPPKTGTLSVQSQPADAQVSLDGTVAGRTPLRLSDIKPGSHSVALRLDGFQPYAQNVDVTAGGHASVVAKLEREQRVEPAHPPAVGVVEPPPPTPLQPAESLPPRHPGRGAKYAAIGLVAGAVVAGAVAIYTWRTYLKLEDRAHSDLESLAGMATPEGRAFFAEPSCQTPPVPASDTRDSYVSNCNRGTAFSHATTGLWIGAGVLATAGLVSFIVGERLDAKADKERRGKSLQRSLRLVPAISTKGGGLQASFEF